MVRHAPIGSLARPMPAQRAETYKSRRSSEATSQLRLLLSSRVTAVRLKKLAAGPKFHLEIWAKVQPGSRSIPWGPRCNHVLRVGIVIHQDRIPRAVGIGVKDELGGTRTIDHQVFPPRVFTDQPSFCETGSRRHRNEDRHRTKPHMLLHFPAIPTFPRPTRAPECQNRARTVVAMHGVSDPAKCLISS